MLNSHSISQVEPWNTENVNITGKGIKLFQFADKYDHDDHERGPKILTSDQIAWSVLFGPESMENVCFREMQKLPTTNANAQQQRTFIELCFKYKGLPESKDATRLKTEQPEDAAMEDAVEAKGTRVLFRSVDLTLYFVQLARSFGF